MVSATGVSSSPTSAIEPSTTSVPSAVPSTGAMKPSPQGRLPKAPRLPSSPASTIPRRPSSPIRRSLPCRQVIRASEPRLRAVTTAQPRRRISSRSPVISRLSISSVTPGKRADADAGLAGDLARRGVRKRLDRRGEDDVGRGHRRGNRAGRLGGGRVPLGDHGQGRVGAVALRLDPHQRADLFGHRVADDQHVLARFDPHAVADDRLHCPVQLRGHRQTLFRPAAHPSSCRCLNRPGPRTRPARRERRRRQEAAETTPPAAQSPANRPRKHPSPARKRPSPAASPTIQFEEFCPAASPLPSSPPPE